MGTEPETKDPKARLDALTADRKRLADELKTLNDRLEKDADQPNLIERGGNLSTGIVKLDAAIKEAHEEWSDEIMEGVKSGRYLAERGDGSDSSPSWSTKGGAPVGDFAKAILDAGFNLKSRPSVTVNGYDALKASTFPAVTDWSRRSPLLSPKGTDKRWLWPHLPRENVGTDTAIQDFKQTARTLTGTVKRALDAVTDKATLDTTITLVNEALAQFAVTIDEVPNAVLESVRSFSAFMQSEGRFQVEKAIDDHVLAQIVAATPPFGTSGTTTIDKVRNGIASMRATGADPKIVVLNPTDAAALDLSADAGGYVFPTTTTGTSSPLWGLQVVERIGAGTEPPYLIDPVMLGVLYMGTMQFAADPFTNFKKNLTTLRVEINALFHVRNAEGARRIAAS